MLAKRIAFEDQHLQNHLLLSENEKIVTNFNKEGNTYILEFNGPKNTQYESQKFSVKCPLNNHYPFKAPNLYWIGPSPDHRFYKNDTDSHLKPNKTTNLANTDFGIYYEWYSPSRRLIDIIERIKYSLTNTGENELDHCMQSYPNK
jgi:ubiquitin-protein ligase